MVKILCVGAGLSGAVVAENLAEKGFHVTVIDEKPQVGGHCQTYRDEETSIMIHKYGPHIFHTDNKDVWDYVQRFSEFKKYVNRVKAKTESGTYSLPVNLLTLNQFFKKDLSPKEAYELIRSKADKSISNPRNFEEQALSMMGEELYYSFFYHYTKKQWGRDPKELPASVLKRLPFRFNFDDNYFTHSYQGIPVEGYTEMIKSMLNHPNIVLELKKSYTHEMAKDFHHVFYSGQIDRFFDFKYGKLEYRTLDFEKFYPEKSSCFHGDFQGGAVVNYCSDDADFTRITEHKHFTPWEEHEETVCYREFSRNATDSDLPFYPVLLSGENDLLETIKDEAAKLTGVTFIGRLGLYKYLDMDVTISTAMKTAKRFLDIYKPENPCYLPFIEG